MSEQHTPRDSNRNETKPDPKETAGHRLDQFISGANRIGASAGKKAKEMADAAAPKCGTMAMSLGIQFQDGSLRGLQQQANAAEQKLKSTRAQREVAARELELVEIVGSQAPAIRIAGCVQLQGKR